LKFFSCGEEGCNARAKLFGCGLMPGMTLMVSSKLIISESEEKLGAKNPGGVMKHDVLQISALFCCLRA
jgi:hypothetical protein